VRLRHGHAWFQPSDDVEIVRAALALVRVAVGQHERKPDADVAGERKPPWHRADDLIVPSIEPQRAADDVRCASKA
jgi:hypothetical protein